VTRQQLPVFQDEIHKNIEVKQLQREYFEFHLKKAGFPLLYLF